MNKNVLACITAYYPGEGFERVCKIISAQVGQLLIVDNSEGGDLVRQAFSLTDNTSIVGNANVGAVSGALNIGLQYARDNGFEYLHIFDQDTLPPADITSSLMKAFEKNECIALVSPRFINSSTNFPGRVLTIVSKWRMKSVWPQNDLGALNVLFTISSASLIKIDRLPANAFYDTRLLVDGCDIDFGLSLKNAGLDIVVDTSVTVHHGLGERKKGGNRWSATNYSPLRKQLSSKNRMMIWRRYWSKFPGYVINDGVIFVLDSGRTLVFEKDRFKKLIALAKGLVQGLKEKNIKTRLEGNTYANINPILSCDE